MEQIPGYLVEDVPREAWDRFLDRCMRDEWRANELLAQLIDDYGAGRITPTVDRSGLRSAGFMQITCSQNHTNEVRFAKESVRSAQPDAPVRCPTCGDVVDLQETERLHLLMWAHTEDEAW